MSVNKTRAALIALVLCLFLLEQASAQAAKPHLFVPDGQFLTSPIKVYLSETNLGPNAKPVLRLVGFYSGPQSESQITNVWKPFFVSGGQSWTERIAGQSVSLEGSLLLFDLADYPLARYKSTARLTPVLTWEEGANNSLSETIIGNPIYLGKPVMAGFWTLLAVGSVIALIYGLCKVKKDDNIRGFLSLVSGPDNYMSLWRTQLAAWTLAVGGMVFFFGMIQLEVPKIPETLVALMGMSVATGSLSTIAARSKRDSSPKTMEDRRGPSKNHRPEFSDLISSYMPDRKLVVLSVPKAQMLFWTCVILILFVTKSLLTGELWDVPWEMVALTGVSQAGYVSDKALHGEATNAGGSPKG